MSRRRRPIQPHRRSVAPGRGATRAAKLKIPGYALAALEAQARRLYRRRQHRRAAALAERVLEFDPGRSYAWFVLGDIAMRQAHWQRALQYFDRALRCRPDAAMIWCRGGEALLKLSAYTTAEAWFLQAIQRESARPSHATRRAKALLARYHDFFLQARQRLDPNTAGGDRTQAMTEADFALHRPRHDKRG